MRIAQDIFNRGYGLIQVVFTNGLKVGDNSNNTTIEIDGSIILNGNATVWEDIDFPIVIRTTGSNVPTQTTFISDITAPLWHTNDYASLEGREIPHCAKLGA